MKVCVIKLPEFLGKFIRRFMKKLGRRHTSSHSGIEYSQNDLARSGG